MQKILCTILLLTIGVATCASQSVDSITNTIYGKTIQGVQMSIVLSTNVLTRGCLIGVFTEIQNGSTNDIYLSEIAPATDFLIVLTDGQGNKHELTDTHPLIISHSFRMKLKPGEKGNWIVPVPIGKNLPSGESSLEAIRKFQMEGQTYHLESNSLKIDLQ